MKLYTFARKQSECSGHGYHADIQSIARFNDRFPPVFLSLESAKDWQSRITNPLTNEDLLERFHWEECKIVELELQMPLLPKTRMLRRLKKPSTP